MNSEKQKRKRGITLTFEGLKKLQEARFKSEANENFGERYTFDNLSERTGLDNHTVRRVLDCKQGVDKRTIERFFLAFGLELSKDDYLDPTAVRQQHWGEAICVSAFQGRTEELATLEEWLFQEHCRLIALLGMGGVGKTSLSVKLAQQVQDKFEYVIWRSLRDAPPIEVILTDLLQFLSSNEEKEVNLPENLAKTKSLLMEYLRKHRCLIVLDNVESLLCSGSRAGQYRDGYEGYGDLLRLVGETSHQSCLMLTSREKPKEVVLLEGNLLPVRSLQVGGLNVAEGLEIFQLKGLSIEQEQCKTIIERYVGNPLALKIVASTIQDIFDGHANEFLKQDTTIFGDIRDILEQQFLRLSDLEKDIMYWLAVNREPIALAELREDIVSPIPPLKLVEALESLGRRSLIEKVTPTLVEKSAALFTLQPVIMEYVINRLVDQVCGEIETHNIDLFRCHALMKATAKDYVKETQVRLILKPVIDGLVAVFRSKRNLENQLTQILAKLRETSALEQSYTAGNIFNLLYHLEADLSGYDFSNLTVWQADLRNVNLHKGNFAHANLAKCVFAETLGGIHSVAFSPDGKLLATADTNNEIRLYQVADRKQLLTCKGHTGWVWPVTFSPDGHLLASGSDDQTVKLWDTRTGLCLATLHGHSGGIWSVAFSPNGHMLASSSEDKTVRLWDVGTDQCIKTLQGQGGRVWSVAFSPDGHTLASGNDDHAVRLWDIRDGKCIKTLQGHTHRIQSVAFSPDGHTLASGGDDQTVKLWDVSTGECFKTLQGHTDLVQSVGFSPHGNTLASGGDDQTVKLWDVSTGECLKTLKGHGIRVWSVAFSPDGTTLASGSDDQTVKLWDVSTGACLKTLQGYCNGIWSVTFSSQSRMLASGSGDQVVSLWDASTGKCLKTLRGHSNRVTSVSLSPDSSIVASGSEDQTVKLWDVSTGKCLKTLQGHSNRVTSVAFSPNGTMLASGSDDQTVKLWDVSTGKCLKTLQGHTHRVWSVAFSPDGHMLASGCHDQTVRLWNLGTGNCLHTLQGHTDWVWSATFSPDGRKLASGSGDQTVRLWDVSTGHCLATLQGHTNCVYSTAFSVDGRTLVSGSGDQTVKLWDVGTSSCVKTLLAHTKWVWSVAFSPDGQILASASEDGTIKLWDALTGECLTTLRSSRPYEGMNITGVTSVTEATIGTLKTLGAIEYTSK